MDCHKGGIVTKSFHHAPHMNSEPGWNVFSPQQTNLFVC